MRFITSAKKTINESDRLHVFLKWIAPLIEVLVFSFIWIKILEHLQLYQSGVLLLVAAVSSVALFLNIILRVYNLRYKKSLLVRVLTFAVIAGMATYVVSAHLFGIDNLLSIFAETNNLLESLKQTVANAPLSVKITLASFVFFTVVFIGAASEAYLAALFVQRQIKTDSEKT
jgi:signal transduction histidine kinase